MFRSIGTARGLLLMSLTIAAFASLTTQASAQVFGRVANEPYSGRITVVNQIKTAINPADRFKDTLDLKRDKVFKDAILNAKNNVPSKPVPDSKPLQASVDLGPVIANAWHKARPKVIEKAIAFLNEKDIGSGFRTSRNSLSLAEDGELFVGVDGLGMTFRYVLRGNELSTWLRTPTTWCSSTSPTIRTRSGPAWPANSWIPWGS